MLARSLTFQTGVVAAMPKLRAFARSLCKNRDYADDLVQETVLRALGNEAKFDPATNLNAWLFTILRNHFYSDIRKRRREVEDADGVFSKNVPIEDSPLKKMEAREALRLVEDMPPEWRIPLRLLADGATYEEIAAELTQQVGTVKSRISRGRALLRAAE